MPQCSMGFGLSKLSRRGRRIEARTFGNGCSPDGATMYDGAMSCRCIVSDTQRAAGIAVQDTFTLDVDPLTNNDRLVVARTADPNQILDPEPMTTFPMIVAHGAIQHDGSMSGRN